MSTPSWMRLCLRSQHESWIVAFQNVVLVPHMNNVGSRQRHHSHIVSACTFVPIIKASRLFKQIIYPTTCLPVERLLSPLLLELFSSYKSSTLVWQSHWGSLESKAWPIDSPICCVRKSHVPLSSTTSPSTLPHCSRLEQSPLPVKRTYPPLQ